MALWRVFDTQGQAQAYCAQCWVTMVRAHAATLTRQEMDDHWNLPTRAHIPDIPDVQINGQRFPIYCRNALTGEWNTRDGFTRASADPRETAEGKWAVQCLDLNDPKGVSEPTWPPIDVP